MRIITWNVRSAKNKSSVWQQLLKLRPDIALLQEVGTIPDEVESKFQVRSRQAVKKDGRLQNFSTSVLVKGKIIDEIHLSSKYEWVNKELEFFKGNFISYTVSPVGIKPLNVVSVYSPAWPVDKKRLKGIDVSPVKLKLNPDVWASEIIWSSLKNTISKNEKWVVGGDYNSSETFDKDWPGGPPGLVSDGNKEIRERMYDLGFKECLLEYQGKLTPTFQNSTDRKVIHQIDHLYVTTNLFSKLKSCKVSRKSLIFGKGLSDHLPIIADFSNTERH